MVILRGGKMYKLLQGNCLKLIEKIPDDSIDLVLIDPPYAISKDSNFNKGKPKNNDCDRFRISIDFGEWDDGNSFTEDDLNFIINQLYRVLKTGGTLICFYDLWKITTLSNILKNNKFVQLRFLEWIKTNPVPINSKINYLTNAREIMISAVKKKSPVFNSEYDNGIYSYPICHGKERTIHPTQKPLALINDLILKHSNENDMVLDCFMGSGSTGVSCLNTNRNFIGMELDEKYFSIAKERIENVDNK